MKKLLAIAIAIIAVLSMTMPVMAGEGDITTTVNISAGQGTEFSPVVVAKWEWTDEEDIPGFQLVDDDEVAAGLQIEPPLKWQTTKTVFYFALVDDPDGDENVQIVYADVWHPDKSPYPYNVNEYFKYQQDLSRTLPPGLEELTARGALCGADAANIVTYGNGFDLASVLAKVDEQSVGFWCGINIIDYEQPAGTYDVQIRAVDFQNNVGTLNNTFYYLPVSMVEFDFGSLSYGSVFPNLQPVYKQIDGNRTFVSPDLPAVDAELGNGATVRNIGNVYSKITIQESDLYQGGLPLGKTDGQWNIHYNARMGDPDIPPIFNYYVPNQSVTLYQTLYLSSWEKIDFGIWLSKFGVSGTWTGTMTLGSVIDGFSAGAWEGDVECATGPYNPITQPS